jgi:hypothetical protein
MGISPSSTHNFSGLYKKRLYYFAFSQILLILLLTVPTYWATLQGKWNKNSVEEQRILATFPAISWKGNWMVTKDLIKGNVASVEKILWDQILDRAYQRRIERASIDQFPLRIHFIEMALTLERSITRLSYSLLDDPAIPASWATTELVMRDESMLLYTPAVFDDQVKKNIDARIQNYKKLVSLYPNQHFYIFYVERLHVSKYHPMNSYYPGADNGRSFEYFEKNLPAEIGLSKLMLTSYQDFVRNFFHTDHHWNIYGAWKGYEEIYKMLAPDYPEIGPELKLNRTYQLPGIQSLGSLARGTLYPITPDPFEVADVKMPPYDLYITGNKTPVSHRLEDRVVNPDLNPYYYYYRALYITIVSTREYYFHNNAPRNLLVITNSFGNSMVMYVASHYQHTYQLDLRSYKNYSLGKLIKKYGINDVIILGDEKVDYQDPVWLINP